MQPQEQKPVATKPITAAWVHAPNLQRLTQPLLRSERGSAAIEYALILGLVGSVLLTSVSALGNASMATFSKISTALESAREHAPMQGEATAPQSISVAPPSKS
jgi:Flp pilus assembly pilin Flp